MPQDDKALVEVDPISVAIVLRQCRITFGGVEQPALPERAAALIEAQASDKARIDALEAENARLREALKDTASRAHAVLSRIPTEFRNVG